MEKIRFTYSKSKLALYLTNDELISLFEKALIKAGIGLVYANGVPKIEIASPLELGVESEGEIGEVLVKENVDLPYFIKDMNKNLPQGVTILQASYQEVLDYVNLPSKVVSSDYKITINYVKEFLENKTNHEVDKMEKDYERKMMQYLSADQILVTKKSKNRMEKIDIKPFVTNYDYKFNVLDVTLVSNKQDNITPDILMSGFSEFVDSKIYYDAKRVKINLGKNFDFDENVSNIQEENVENTENIENVENIENFEDLTELEEIPNVEF